MYKKRIVRILVLIPLLLLIAVSGSPTLAQSYSFGVPSLKMQVYIQPDASVRIVYDITFENYGRTIDIVDIGTPHANYDISNMRASMDSVNLSDIRKSEYVNPGIEVHLGSQAIEQGGSGTLHFEFTMPNLVYQDTTRKDYASLQITPTWFDSGFVEGTSNIQIAVHMLPSIQAEEMLYHDVEFDQKAIYDGRTVALWQWPEGKATHEYLVGVSFPQRGMERVVKMSIFELIAKWLRDNPGIRFILIAATMVLFTILFFRFSGGTGFTLYFILGAGLFILIIAAPFIMLLAVLILPVLIFFNERSLKSKRKKYLPPIAQVEGGGIKRGLTAPEAATLLEMPLNKVLTLVIFGLLEKGILEQVEESPLTVEVTEAFRAMDNPALKTPEDRAKHRRKAAQDKGTVIHKYEQPFLDKLEYHKGKPVQKIDFGNAMKKLIEQTSEKMKGFDLSDTQDYYQRIIDRAWQKAQGIEEIPEREQFLDRYLPWVIMNDDYPTVMTWGGYNYWPRWVRRSPRWGSVGGGGLQSPVSAKGRSSAGGRTTFGHVAASFAGWAENTMGSMSSAIMPGSLKLPGGSGGVVNLSGVDKVTGDVFEALLSSSGSGGGGGGGGGCACACAGCACACACAGGGR